MDREEIRMAPSPGRSGVLRISRFLNTKEKLKIGNWNVRTMNQIGKIQQVENEFMKYSLDILALSETRCKGSGKEALDQGNTYIYSGRADGIGREGVGMMLTPRAVKALTEWKAINSRLLLARFKSRQCNLSFIVCYAPTNDSLEEVKDAFYEELQSVIDEIPERDMRVVIGDMNAKVGRDNQGIENVMGLRVSVKLQMKMGHILSVFVQQTILLLEVPFSSRRISTNIHGRHPVVKSEIK